MHCLKKDLPWVGPELGGSGVGRYFVRTFEADYFLRVAVGQQLIGPDATVTLRVVNQSCVAMILIGMAMGTSDVGGAAGVARRVKAELILASRTADRGHWKIIFFFFFFLIANSFSFEAREIDMHVLI